MAYVHVAAQQAASLKPTHHLLKTQNYSSTRLIQQNVLNVVHVLADAASVQLLKDKKEDTELWH